MAAKDPGRGRAVKDDALMQFACKTPTLRSVAARPPFLHDGSAATLINVIRLYEKGGMERPSRSPLIVPLELTEEDRADLFVHGNAHRREGRRFRAAEGRALIGRAKLERRLLATSLMAPLTLDGQRSDIQSPIRGPGLRLRRSHASGARDSGRVLGVHGVQSRNRKTAQTAVGGLTGHLPYWSDGAATASQR